LKFQNFAELEQVQESQSQKQERSLKKVTLLISAAHNKDVSLSDKKNTQAE